MGEMMTEAPVLPCLPGGRATEEELVEMRLRAAESVDGARWGALIDELRWRRGITSERPEVAVTDREMEGMRDSTGAHRWLSVIDELALRRRTFTAADVATAREMARGIALGNECNEVWWRMLSSEQKTAAVGAMERWNDLADRMERHLYPTDESQGNPSP